MAEREIVVASLVHMPAALVWRAISSLEGLEDELSPWVRVRLPPRDRERMQAGQPDGVSVNAWVLLGGLWPVDRFWSRVAVVDRARGLSIDSTSVLFRKWRLERRVEELAPARTTLHDRLCYAPRLPVPRGWVDPWVLRTLVHRHRRLQKKLGGHFIDPQLRAGE